MNRFISLLVCASLVAGASNGARASGSISLDIRELDIYDVIRLLSTQSATNVVVDNSVPHRPITLRLRDVTFDEAIATIAQSNDLESARVGDIVYLGTGDVVNRRYPSGRRSKVFTVRNGSPDEIAKSTLDAVPKGTLVIPDRRTSSVIVSGSPIAIARASEIIDALDRRSAIRNDAVAMRYVKASDALKALQASMQVASPSSAFASDQQNEIVLAGSEDFIEQARALVARVDRPGQQVRYDVRVTDLVPTESSNIGVLFGGGDVSGQQQAASGSTVSTFLRNSLLVNATINALVSKGEARILARPSISSLNNVRASLLVGQQYPVVYFDARTGTQQVQFVNVGVNLTVTPTIGTDGAITTDLETDYSQLTGLVQSFPVITTRKAQSTLRVRDGETIVIAGLFSDVDERSVTKVPFLADIPVVGELFKNRQRNHSRDEVVFLITPHLVTDGDPTNSLPAPEPETRR